MEPKEEDEDVESEVEWEDVDNQDCESSKDPGARSSEVGSLEIVVSTNSSVAKSKRRCPSELEKALAASERKFRHNLHKVHLLCLISRGIWLSEQCNNLTLQSILLSLLAFGPQELVLNQSESYSKLLLLRLMKWFNAESSCIRAAVNRECEGLTSLSKEQLFVSLLRCLGLSTRLVMVLDPIPFKVPTSMQGDGKKRSHLTEVGGEKCTERKGKGCGMNKVTLSNNRIDGNSGNGHVEGVDQRGLVEGRKGVGFGEKLLEYNLNKGSLQESNDDRPTRDYETMDIGASSGCNESRTVRKNARKKQEVTKRSTRATKVQSPLVAPQFKKQQNKRKQEKTVSDDDEQGSKFKNASLKVRKTNYKRSKLKPSVSDEVSKVKSCSAEEEEDSDWTASRNRKRKSSLKTSTVKKLKMAMEESKKKERLHLLDGEDISSGSGCGTKRLSPEVEVLNVDETGSWSEVYFPDRKRWLCVHLTSCSIDQPQLCEKHCLLPLHYVVAFQNDTPLSDVIVRDVTARYASTWCTETRKHRLSEEWWAESLHPFRTRNLIETMEENEDILSKLSTQSLPLAISEYKNNPLYALKRHLLKFEVIYPEDSPVLGHCKGEAIYSRTNVHTLHTRETWLKEGRMIRVGEKAYSQVKARPKKGQSTLESQNNMVEVYGRWQTEEYMPPLIVDGKVPRNEYGNIEMFKPSMLPVGGAHIRIPGIQRVARKLNIDYAPAMTGWDFHSGYSHPTFDGIVVAKEFEEIIMDAWQTEEQITIEKEMKKREKRVFERWRKLVRGILIKERVREQFDNINNS